MTQFSKKQIVEYNPTIAERKAMTTALMTAEEIAVKHYLYQGNRGKLNE